jgi:hypothetical protein
MNMFVIRKVADTLGCELHEIADKMVQAQTNTGLYYEVCLAALHYKTNDGDDMTETAKSVVSMEQLNAAGQEFIKAYAQFFGLKGDSEGE